VKIAHIESDDRIVITLKEDGRIVNRTRPGVNIAFGLDEIDEVAVIEVEHASRYVGPEFCVIFSVIRDETAGNKANYRGRDIQEDVPKKAGRKTNWLWPHTGLGRAIIVILLLASTLTFFIDPLFFWVNVLFWYLVLIVVRAVCLVIARSWSDV